MDFKALRDRKEWTQTQAAISCGVAVVTWRLWESGGGQPSPKNMAKIREVFNILPFAEE